MAAKTRLATLGGAVALLATSCSGTASDAEPAPQRLPASSSTTVATAATPAPTTTTTVPPTELEAALDATDPFGDDPAAVYRDLIAIGNRLYETPEPEVASLIFGADSERLHHILGLAAQGARYEAEDEDKEVTHEVLDVSVWHERGVDEVVLLSLEKRRGHQVHVTEDGAAAQIATLGFEQRLFTIMSRDASGRWQIGPASIGERSDERPDFEKLNVYADWAIERRDPSTLTEIGHNSAGAIGSYEGDKPDETCWQWEHADYGAIGSCWLRSEFDQRLLGVGRPGPGRAREVLSLHAATAGRRRDPSLRGRERTRARDPA